MCRMSIQAFVRKINVPENEYLLDTSVEICTNFIAIGAFDIIILALPPNE